MSIKEELKNLAVGDYPDRIIWIRKGYSNINATHLPLFHKLGITSRDYKGKIFFVRSIKYFRPFDAIVEDDLRAIELLEEKNLSREQPTKAEEDPSPFPAWGFGFGIARPTNNFVPVTNNKNPEPEPELKPDDNVSDDNVSDDDADMFALFD